MKNELRDLKQAIKEEKDMTWEQKMLSKTTSDPNNIGFGKEVLKRRNANKLARKQRIQNKKK